MAAKRNKQKVEQGAPAGAEQETTAKEKALEEKLKRARRLLDYDTVYNREDDLPLEKRGTLIPMVDETDDYFRLWRKRGAFCIMIPKYEYVSADGKPIYQPPKHLGHFSSKIKKGC